MREFRFITAAQYIRQTDKEWRRREFIARQFTLASVAVVQFAGWMFTGYLFFLLLGVFVVKAGAVEALRFRRAGTTIQTKRCIWRGSTPEDARMLAQCPKPKGYPC